MHPAPPTMRRVLGMDVIGVLDRLRFIKPVVKDEALADQLDRMFRQSDRSRDGSIEERTSERVRELLRKQLRPVNERGPTLRGQRAAELVRLRINESRRKMTSMAELSALTGLSRFHLSRTFRDITGLPPYQYFEQVRLARAKVLLRKGHEISAVAMALGYSDQSHFHRQFRAVAATTPGRYAKALRDVFCPSR
jgi:AraC-like DNA-binding protein